MIAVEVPLFIGLFVVCFVAVVAYMAGYDRGFTQGAKLASLGAEKTINALARACKLVMGLDASREVSNKAAEILMREGSVSPELVKEMEDG